MPVPPSVVNAQTDDGGGGDVPTVDDLTVAEIRALPCQTVEAMLFRGDLEGMSWVPSIRNFKLNALEFRARDCGFPTDPVQGAVQAGARAAEALQQDPLPAVATAALALLGVVLIVMGLARIFGVESAKLGPVGLSRST